MPEFNQAGLELIKESEELRLKAYQDCVAVWTIGYGHTANVTPDQTITEAEALSLLRDDVAQAEHAIRQYVTQPLSDNAYSALVSFVFNVGATQFADSTLLKLLNQGKFSEAADQFPRWVHAGPQVLPGLVVRRQKERTLFLDGGTEDLQWRLFAPGEDYKRTWTLATDRERLLVAWIAEGLGLRHRAQADNHKVFLSLPAGPEDVSEPAGRLTITPLLQTTDVACGQTCVAMVVNALDSKHLTDRDIDQRYGFELLRALNEECASHGYAWRDGGDLTSTSWPLVATTLKSGLPVILGLNGPEFSPSGRGHIITLVSLQGAQITFADPARGVFRTVPLQDVLDAPPHPDGKFIFYPRRVPT